MGIFKSLFGHRAKNETYTIPEDIFLSSGYVYYEENDEYVKNGTYDVFTLYPSLYDENSDDNFYKLCDDIVKEVLKDSLIILSIKIIDISFKDELLNNILNFEAQNIRASYISLSNQKSLFSSLLSLSKISSNISLNPSFSFLSFSLFTIHAVAQK